MIYGWIRTSFIDYPDHVASVLFTGGCSFRCPMCHNADLVLHPESLDMIPLDEVFAFLERRRGLIDGVVFSGGEPTLRNDLPAVLRKAKENGLDIKLDTNGYHPDRLRPLLEEGLLDYIAMDVKSPPEGYARLAGLPALDFERIATSIHMLRTSGREVEFRTTVVPDWLTQEDIREIGQMLQGAPRYVLQQFRPERTLVAELESLQPYPREVLEAMADSVRPWFDEVLVRGV